jgi:hypothetical protein
MCPVRAAATPGNLFERAGMRATIWQLSPFQPVSVGEPTLLCNGRTRYSIEPVTLTSFGTSSSITSKP